MVTCRFPWSYWLQFSSSLSFYVDAFDLASQRSTLHEVPEFCLVKNNLLSQHIFNVLASFYYLFESTLHPTWWYEFKEREVCIIFSLLAIKCR